MRDSRLVQTAVIGDEHSDVPIVLPPEAIELDVFRHAHEGNTFWCGVLIGGCGAQLATKLYVDRQCHFQHFPQPNGMPNTCRRPAVGESSADHLYVKSAMSRSLLDHGRAALFAFPPPIGSLVDVELEDGTSLRIYMDGSVRPDWDAAERTVVLGPGVVPEPGTLAGCPYVYRVRCDSDGATRRVWIGTQSLAHPTDWIPLSECTWGDEGLLTPARPQAPSGGRVVGAEERTAATGSESPRFRAEGQRTAGQELGSPRAHAARPAGAGGQGDPAEGRVRGDHPHVGTDPAAAATGAFGPGARRANAVADSHRPQPRQQCPTALRAGHWRRP
ncbi:hypothetical protein ACWECC_11345 [Streptomyces microflavus]